MFSCIRVLTLTILALSAWVAPIAAHDFPADGDKAKDVTTTGLDFGNGHALTVRQVAMHWRKDIYDAILTGNLAQFFKPYNFYRRIGSAEFASAVTLGGTQIAAGSYTIRLKSMPDNPEDLMLEFKSEAGAIADVPIKAEKSGNMADHFSMTLTPIHENGDFALILRYGPFTYHISGAF